MAFDVFATCLGGMGIQFIWVKSAHLRDVSVGKNVDAPKFKIETEVASSYEYSQKQHEMSQM